MNNQNIGIGTKIYKPLDTNEKMEFYANCAVWCNENGADLIDKGDYYEICERVAPLLPELKAYKEQRKIELNSLHEVAEEESHVLSSLGFEIDANNRANRDIAGLLITTKEGETVKFCDYSNVMHDVTRADLEVMQKEIILNAQNLYTQKWSFRNQIEAMETSYALSTLKFEFFNMSFYEQA